MKYPEHILAVRTAGFLAALGNNIDLAAEPFISAKDFPREKVLEAIKANLVISRREELEKDETHLQLLPYHFLWRHGLTTQETFVYQRSKKQGESRLLGMHSVGVGGHMDFADVRHAEGVIDIETTLAKAQMRELQEEIAINGKSYAEHLCGHQEASPVYTGLLLDRSDAVGRVHVGLVYGVQVPTQGEVVCVGDGMVARGFHPNSGLADLYKEMENWSKLLCDFEFGVVRKVSKRELTDLMANEAVWPHTR